ncbi:MAG: hypothetical protein E6H03_04840 [Bacillati bacterium ANGP1]|uniref:Phosphoesterase n=1 Tax=Candidatus Segetimicrobium genomatis TaxID=2569760 RepID=A0A537JIC7_9BACT|nr:MAG: hypothetical protein E6H03_04840 [Terrabacteria group bacterium ANGP1]
MDRRAFVRWAIAAAAVAATLGGAGRAPARSRWWSSLVVGVFENHGFDQVAGLPSHRRLAREGTVLARYSGVSHPSGPNYRAMISGATWGVRETIDTFHPSVASEAAAQAPPIPTYVYHLAGEIPQKHNPFADLRAPVASVRRGLDAFRRDLAGALPTPALVYVGWDDENSMHDGPPALADRNLTALLDTLAASSVTTRMTGTATIESSRPCGGAACAEAWCRRPPTPTTVSAGRSRTTGGSRRSVAEPGPLQSKTRGCERPALARAQRVGYTQTQLSAPG